MSAARPEDALRAAGGPDQALVQRMQGIDAHLMTRVMPHLPESAGYAVTHLIEALDEEEEIDPNLHFYVDAVLGEMRTAIAAGTTEEQVPIPREQPDRLHGGVRYAQGAEPGRGVAPRSPAAAGGASTVRPERRSTSPRRSG